MEEVVTTEAEEVTTPLTIFESVKKSIFEKSAEGIISDNTETLYVEFFEICNDESTNTLIKKRRVIESFLEKNNIPDLADFSRQFNQYYESLSDYSQLLNNTYFTAIRKLEEKRSNIVTVGILELMLKGKIEKDLREEDATINSKQ